MIPPCGLRPQIADIDRCVSDVGIFGWHCSAILLHYPFPYFCVGPKATNEINLERRIFSRCLPTPLKSTLNGTLHC